jgi:ABC-type multidrug transport system permease subunit
VYFFGVTLSVNIAGAAIVLALGIGTFIGISMIGSGILILTKQGDPVTALMTIAISLFGNVLFPPQVLPPFLRIIAYISPPYYFMTCIKQTLTGSTIAMILPNLEILALMCVIIVPLGYAIYAWCLKTARKNGTLSWF